MNPRDELIEKYAAEAESARERVETETDPKERGKLKAEATRAEKKVRALEAYDLIPNALLRERCLIVVERDGLSLSEIAQRAGLVSKSGKVDTTFLQRLLGMVEWVNRKGYPPITSDAVSYEMAVRIAEALDVPPEDAHEIPERLLQRPVFKRYERKPGCGFKDCDRDRVRDLGSGQMCATHSERLRSLREELTRGDARARSHYLNRSQKADAGLLNNLPATVAA